MAERGLMVSHDRTGGAATTVVCRSADADREIGIGFDMAIRWVEFRLCGCRGLGLSGGVTARPDYGFLPKGFDLEPELLDQISARPGNQRCLIGHDELLLIVHEVPMPGIPEREPLVFWRTPGGGWFGPDSGKGLGLLSALQDRYQVLLDQYEAVIDEPDGAAAVFKVARHAGPLARSTRNMLVALDQALTHDDDNRDLMALRDKARELERAAELLFHDAKLVIDFRQAENAEAQQAATERLNTIAFRLNLMAGFFLPLLGLGGLLGMNVDLPEFIRSWFWGIFFGGVVLGIGVLLLVGWNTNNEKK